MISDAELTGEECRECRTTIGEGESVLEVLIAGQWFDGHGAGGLVHLSCLGGGVQ